MIDPKAKLELIKLFAKLSASELEEVVMIAEHLAVLKKMKPEEAVKFFDKVASDRMRKLAQPAQHPQFARTLTWAEHFGFHPGSPLSRH